MLIINLFGAPSAGKSTFAAALFVACKQSNIPVELSGETTKDLIYSGAMAQMENQFYLTALQYKKLKDLERCNTKICISDSPLLLKLFYGQHLSYAKKLNDLTLDLNNEFINYNVLILRKTAYSTHGRYHTEEESNEIEQELLSKKDLLDFKLIVNGDDDGRKLLIENVLNFFRENG